MWTPYTVGGKADKDPQWFYALPVRRVFDPLEIRRGSARGPKLTLEAQEDTIRYLRL